MKNKLQTILLCMVAILFLFISCDNYLVNGGIREYIEGFGASNFTITFDANGGEGTMKAQSVKSGEATTINANTFTRSNYSFASWNTTADGSGVSYAEKAEITATENITLYAQWAEIITITFDANGNGAEITGAMEVQKVIKGVPVAINANSFTHTGYGFVKWTTAADGTGEEYADRADISTTESITLYAQWAEELTITFISPGSSVTMPPQIVLSGIKTILNENILTNTDPKFRFTGWTDQDGNKYTDKATVTITKDTTLTATWSNNFWTITFDGNGGMDGSESKKYQYVEKDTETTIPVNTFTKTDATFAIWNSTEDGSGTDHAAGEPFTPSDDSTLFAQWDYTVTFEVDGGSPVAEMQVREKTLVTKPSDPTKDHYEFEGWYKDSALTDDWDFANDKVEGKTTLYAKWTPVSYTITFHGNGGSVPDGRTTYTQSVQSGAQTALDANKFTNAGYDFIGWRDGSGGTTYTDKADILITESTDLYAQWKEKTTITFNTNTGTGTMEPQIFKGDGSEEYLSLNGFKKAEHEFVGWNTIADGKGTPFADGGLITFTTSTTLYAQWSKNFYTITYKGNGGEVVNGGGAKEYEQHVERGVSAQLKPKTFAKEGTIFVGWNTNQDGSGTTYQNNETVAAITASYNLHAQWGYTVSFNTNGGEEIPSQLVIENKTFVTGGSIPPSPTKENSIFEGWYKENGLSTKWDFEKDTVTDDITLYAKWIKKENTISFDKNGGSGTMDAKIVTPLVETSLSKNTYTYEGKLFTGWNTVQNGVGGKSYADEAKITTNADITLYAQWADKLTITFNVNGGLGSMDDQVVGSGIASILKKNTLTHSDSTVTFTGWNTHANGSGDSYADEAEITIIKNTELFAQWASDVWVITYYANGGSVSGSGVTEYTQNVQKESAINLQPNGFSLAGSTFVGWTTNAEGTGKVYTNSEEISPDRDLKLYAKWNRTVTITYYQNFGSNLTQTQDVNEGEATTLNKNLFERERFYFTGWSKQVAGGGTIYRDEQTNVLFNDDTELFAQWIVAPYSDTTAKTIVSNGYNLKMVSESGGSTIKWLYDSEEIALADIGSSNIASGSDLSSYSIVNARSEDGNYLQTGDHILEGGAIRSVEGMNTVFIKGNLSVGSNGMGGIVLTKAGQLEITGALTGSDEGVIVRSHTIKQGGVIASVSSGGDPTAKLTITNSYGSFAVQVEYKNGQVLALGQLGLTPSENIEWNGKSFSIPDIQLGVAGTIFSISVEGGTFTTGEETTIEGASLSMGIPVSGSESYVEELTRNTNYTYVQFFPASGSDEFPAVGANDFVKTLTFTPTSASVGMSVKINLETVALDIVESYNVSYFNGSFYKLYDFGGANTNWNIAYYTAKGTYFNGLQGYLMNITSSTENDFIFEKFLGNVEYNGWIGGTRFTPSSNVYDLDSWSQISAAGDDWYWASGPEAGDVFYRGKHHTNAGDNTGLYNAWNAGVEPNNGAGGASEQCAHFIGSNTYGNKGKWNDYSNQPKADSPVKYAFVEYTPYGIHVADAKAAFAEELYIKK